MKPINDRCPLQGECERKKCEFKNRELECAYYHSNARPGYEIADQEANRYPSPDLDEEDPAEEEEQAPPHINGLLCRLPIDKLVPHPDNPRKDLGDLTELAASIKAKGILQNLTVVDADDDTYRIVIGHRRHAAAKLAGLTKLPCVIADMTPQEQFETMMVENIQRSNLTAYEQAEGFQLMLDMGGSVEQVAQKTGFSESTIRRRVKLLALDKGEFQKAEGRGATMTDYLKLNDIQDPKRRNQVLKTIGTSEFNYHLTSAIKDQEFQAKFAEALKFLQEADWIKVKTTEDISYYGPWKSVRYFNKSNQKPIQTPTDTDTSTYIYTAGVDMICIYRYIPESERSTAETMKDHYRDKAAQIEKELAAITKMHREMREEFIMNFSTFNNDQMDIEAFAAKALMAYSYGTISHELLSKISGVPLVTSGNVEVVDGAIWKQMLSKWPQKALLSATYARLERVGNTYYTTQYYDTMRCSVPKHQKCETLDLLYEGLVSLGYEMCEDEKLMQSGKHPVFQKAKDLLKDFKKESKNG